MGRRSKYSLMIPYTHTLVEDRLGHEPVRLLDLILAAMVPIGVLRVKVAGSRDKRLGRFNILGCVFGRARGVRSIEAAPRVLNVPEDVRADTRRISSPFSSTCTNSSVSGLKWTPSKSLNASRASRNGHPAVEASMQCLRAALQSVRLSDRISARKTTAMLVPPGLYPPHLAAPTLCA
ncbi:hypothetical protein KC361_g51 [Hortaea werneckii]|nr:hypothetical protein KC361_g51 [Hortaea werneckii]